MSVPPIFGCRLLFAELPPLSNLNSAAVVGLGDLGGIGRAGRRTAASLAADDEGIHVHGLAVPAIRNRDDQRASVGAIVAQHAVAVGRVICHRKDVVVLSAETINRGERISQLDFQRVSAGGVPYEAFMWLPSETFTME